MEWEAQGAAKGTKENRSWKKTLWLGRNWDSFISPPDLETANLLSSVDLPTLGLANKQSRTIGGFFHLA